VGFGPLISSVKSPVRSRPTLTTEQNRLQLSSYILFFSISMGGKVSDGGRGLLLGILTIFGCSVVVNRGEVVVNCVVDVDSGTPLLWSLKVGHRFEVYFENR
jgi:hypothetical protein